MRSRKTIATPPGATIREQLEDRGMTQKEFAVRMDLSEKHISRLINGEVRLTPDVALRLESVLGVPAEFWNNLESRYRERLARVEEENAMEADQKMASHFPYSEMVSYGWIEETRKPTERVMHLRRFFQVASLGALENLIIPGIAYRRLENSIKSNYALAAWAQRARIEATNRETARINLAKLQESINTIRLMTVEDPEIFCPNLTSLLSSCGIALVFLPHMKGSFLHGASFYDGRKIVLGLTVRGRDADKFWFSAFHEIGHILLGHIGLPEGTSKAEEDLADRFAADTLIPPDLLNTFLKRNNISEASILSFARAIEIAPGIVVGRLQKEGIIDFNQYNSLKTKYCLQP